MQEHSNVAVEVIEQSWHLGQSIKVYRGRAWYDAEIVGFESKGTALIRWGADVPRVTGRRRLFLLFGPVKNVIWYYPKRGDITRERLHPDRIRPFDASEDPSAAHSGPLS